MPERTGDEQAIYGRFPPKHGLRYLGRACNGLHVFADGQIRLASALGGKFGADTLTGDAKKQAFFFDTAIELNLGADRINDFGAKDILVTTKKVMDVDMDGVVDFGANGVLDTTSGGTIAVTGLSPLEFGGSISRDGVDYFVYSKVGSAAVVADLVFAWTTPGEHGHGPCSKLEGPPLGSPFLFARAADQAAPLGRPTL